MTEWEKDDRRRYADAEKRHLDRILDKHGFRPPPSYNFVIALQAEMRLGNMPLRRVGRFDDGDNSGVFCCGDGFIAAGSIMRTLEKNNVVQIAKDVLPYFSADNSGFADEILGIVGGEKVSAAAAKEAKKRGLILLRLDADEFLVVENAAVARPVPQKPKSRLAP